MGAVRDQRTIPPISSTSIMPEIAYVAMVDLRVTDCLWFSLPTQQDHAQAGVSDLGSTPMTAPIV